MENNIFKVSFPDRKRDSNACMITTGSNPREVWDRLHRQFPFESIVITAIQLGVM